jgi:choline monooxygenase
MNSNPNNSMPLGAVLEQLKNAASVNFDQAHPIPPAVNHSTEFLNHEKQSVFMQEWICIGREDEVENHGDYLTFDIAGVPVIVIRQKDGQLGAFVNACAHRFACLMPEQKGNSKRLTCRYHAWTYDCSGQLVRAPNMETKPGFEISDHALRPLKFEIWQGFIYVTLAEQPKTRLADVLAPFLEKIVGRFDMANYRTVLRESMTWNANWKNLIENYTESYHVPVAHGKTFAQHNKPLQDYTCGEDSDFYGYHYAPQPEETGPGAAHPDNQRLQGEWRRMMVDFCIFPCHLVTLMPDYLWYISVQSLASDQMQATWGVAVPPEVLNDIKAEDYDQWLAKFKRYIDVANNEDKTLVEALHKGSGSPILPKGTYHPIERNLWQFTRYLARVCAKPNNQSHSLK